MSSTPRVQKHRFLNKPSDSSNEGDKLDKIYRIHFVTLRTQKRVKFAFISSKINRF